MSAQPSTPTDDGPEWKPAGWPRGASEQYVRECNCDQCQDLIERLEGGQQPSLDAFAGDRDE